jgi:DNA-directed RNA polymerase specialized sigma subunit
MKSSIKSTKQETHRSKSLIDAIAYEMDEAGCGPISIRNVCLRLEGMDDRSRVVFLRRIEGWSETEIGREIGLAQSNVSLVIHKRLACLQSLLCSVDSV